MKMQTYNERIKTLVNIIPENKEDIAELILNLQREAVLDFKSWNTGCDCEKCLGATEDYLRKNGYKQ